MSGTTLNTIQTPLKATSAEQADAKANAELRAYEEQLKNAQTIWGEANQVIALQYKARGYPDFEFHHPPVA